MSAVTVIGDGGWGTALALLLHGYGHAVRVWGPFADYAETVNDRRENTRFLPGHPLPADLRFTADPAAALDGAEAAVLAVPSQYFPDTIRRLAADVPGDALVVSVTKGLDGVSHRRMTEIARAALGGRPVAALSGPSFAEEVARGLPTAVVVACEVAPTAEALQGLFNGPAFRVYTSDDVTGVELGGALKNVMAIAAGIGDGIGYGHNTKAALVTRGLAEMTRLGRALGAHPETFAGLSGLGDLMLTCTGGLSRNRRVGEALGRGQTIGEILSGMQQVAEGVVNCTNAMALAEEAGVEVPIIREVHRVIREGKNPREAVRDLFSRDPRPERDGAA